MSPHFTGNGIDGTLTTFCVKFKWQDQEYAQVRGTSLELRLKFKTIKTLLIVLMFSRAIKETKEITNITSSRLTCNNKLTCSNRLALLSLPQTIFTLSRLITTYMNVSAYLWKYPQLSLFCRIQGSFQAVLTQLLWFIYKPRDDFACV